MCVYPIPVYSLNFSNIRIMSLHPGGFHSIIPLNHFEIHIQIPHVPSQFPPQIPWNRREIPIFSDPIPIFPGEITSPVASSSTRDPLPPSCWALVLDPFMGHRALGFLDRHIFLGPFKIVGSWFPNGLIYFHGLSHMACPPRQAGSKLPLPRNFRYPGKTRTWNKGILERFPQLGCGSQLLTWSYPHQVTQFFGSW